MNAPNSELHDESRPITNPRLTRRQVLLGLVGVGSGLGLVACSTGSSREAERGRRQDAERTSVVDEVQATRTAGLILGTPPATPPLDP